MRIAATLSLALATALAALTATQGAFAKDGYSAYGQHNNVASEPVQGEYSQSEVLDAGHSFFGSISGSIATFVEKVFAKHGQPNGYILGQEGGGAFIAGAKYGEGNLYTRNAGVHKVYWQGPNIGMDIGANGTRVMMLVYDLPSVDSIFRQYNGVNTSAFLIGGVGMTVLENKSVGTYLVPVKSGLGARLGINLGYLKFTEKPKWNPF